MIPGILKGLPQWQACFGRLVSGTLSISLDCVHTVIRWEEAEIALDGSLCYYGKSGTSSIPLGPLRGPLYSPFILYFIAEGV